MLYKSNEFHVLYMTDSYCIYCVDDDHFMLQMLAFQLRKHFSDDKIIIELIDDPRLVLSLLEECRRNEIIPILGIIDYQMPEINGAQLIRLIKKKFPAQKFIMVSGNSSAIQISELVEDDSLDFYLSKPWEESDLIDKINKCLPIPIQTR